MSITLNYTNVNGNRVAERELTVEEKIGITSVKTTGTQIIYYKGDEPVYVPTLDELKKLKNIAIDERTMELIYFGFDFDGHHFSLSDRAQGNWAGMIGSIGAGLLTVANFPLTLSDTSDSKYELTWLNALLFCGTAVATVKNRKGSGSDLKQLVNQCSTTEELNAIIDDRI